jgi:hypothetical protein
VQDLSALLDWSSEVLTVIAAGEFWMVHLDGLEPPSRCLLLRQRGAPSTALVCAVTAIASGYGLAFHWDACRCPVVHGA